MEETQRFGGELISLSHNLQSIHSNLNSMNSDLQYPNKEQQVSTEDKMLNGRVNKYIKMKNDILSDFHAIMATQERVETNDIHRILQTREVDTEGNISHMESEEVG